MSWQEYIGEYEKEFYVIRLKNGKEIRGCWPNAGEWHSTLDGKQYDGSEVTHIKIDVDYYKDLNI